MLVNKGQNHPPRKNKDVSLNSLLAGKIQRDKQNFMPPSASTPKPEEPLIGGDRPEWIVVEHLDDNPYQPRTVYLASKLRDLKKSFDQDGQLQAAMARPHPSEPGRFQLAFGHNRKEVVKLGGNAGIGQPQPEIYIGKLYVVVRQEIDDVTMLRYALEENEQRADISVIDRARAYQNARYLVTQKLVSLGHKTNASGKWLAPWRTVAEVYNRNFRDMARIVQVLELPPDILEHFEGDPSEERLVLNTRHARALLELQEKASLQKLLFKEILSSGLDGAAAERRAQALLKGRAIDAPSSIAPSVGSPSDDVSTQGSQVQQSTSSNSRKKNDVIADDLLPAKNFLTHAARTLQESKPSASYREKIVREIEAIEAQIYAIRSELMNP